MIYEWRCRTCGREGVAVALRGDNYERRIELSHRAAQAKRRNGCRKPQLKWTQRESTAREFKP